MGIFQSSLSFDISVIGGVLFVIVFISGWVFGDSIIKRSIRHFALSMIGLLTIAVEWWLSFEGQIWREHAVFFGVGMAVAFASLLFGRTK